MASARVPVVVQVVPGPQAGAPAAGRAPRTVPIPGSSIPPSGAQRGPCLTRCLSSQEPAPSSLVWLVPALRRAPCCDRPREGSASPRFRHAGWLAQGGCQRRGLRRGPEANLSPSIPASSPAPPSALHSSVARKTRRRGAALQGLLERRGLGRGTAALLHTALTLAGWQSSLQASLKTLGEPWAATVLSAGVQTCIAIPAAPILSLCLGEGVRSPGAPLLPCPCFGRKGFLQAVLVLIRFFEGDPHKQGKKERGASLHASPGAGGLRQDVSHV